MNWTSPTTRFLRSNNPKPERQPKVELTGADKKRVVKEFKEVMGRLPNEAEIETLLVEERKLKRETRDSQKY